MSQQTKTANMKYWPLAALLAIGVGVALAAGTNIVGVGIGAGVGSFLLLTRLLEGKEHAEHEADQAER